MAIFDSSESGPLLEQFKTAQDAEGVAITALHDALKNGITDNSVLIALTERMNDAHSKKMDIWDQLQSHRLDK